VVVDAAPQQLAVGEHDLFAAQAAQPGGFQADVFDRAEGIAHDDEVADLEGLVEHDRERGKQVAEDVLGGQGHRDAADTEAGDQRGDIEAEVIQHHQEGHGPYHQPHHEEQDGAGGLARPVAGRGEQLGAPAAQAGVAPDRQLQQERPDGDARDHEAPAVRHDEQDAAEMDPDRQQEDEVGLAQHAHGEVVDPGHGAAREVAQAPQHDGPDEVERGGRTEADAHGHQPVFQIVVIQQELHPPLPVRNIAKGQCAGSGAGGAHN
jgi:hypothetical protein